MNQNSQSDRLNNRSSLDVCIVCALPEEAQAFLRVVGERYRLPWTDEINHRHGYSYCLATIPNGKGEPLNMHISWLPNYGPEEMVLHLSRVIEEYQPHLAAMTGFCAGDKRHVKLGDLVVAQRTFKYDSGKVVKDEQGHIVHEHDTTTHQMHENTLQFLRLFDAWKPRVANLSRPASKRQQRDWLLNRLLAEPTGSFKAIPLAEVEKHAPAWRQLIDELQQGPEPSLSPALELQNKAKVEDLRYGLEPFPFQDPPVAQRHIRPLASGSAVRSDNPFKEIQLPVRGAVAIDMEGAAFGRVMEMKRFRDIEWLIVKGVADYADQEKDDAYHEYAGEASAAYALCFIEAYVTRQSFPISPVEDESLPISHTKAPSPGEGLLSLEKGKKALWDGSYPFAKKELRKAVDEIDRENQLEAASKARYFLALALLEGKVPRIQGREAIQSIEQLMNEAINIHPYASYYRILARIKWDFFEFNGAKHRLNEVLTLDRQGVAYPRCIDDEEHEDYFRHSQPRLQL